MAATALYKTLEAQQFVRLGTILLAGCDQPALHVGCAASCGPLTLVDEQPRLLFIRAMTKPGHRSRFNEALDEAYRNRRKAVQAVAARAGQEDSADVVQDAFLKAVEADRRAGIDSPFGFLLRVARNNVIDRLRRRTRWAKLMTEAPAEFEHADPTPDAERSLIATERLQRAIDCIQAMPERRREVFLLSRLEGLTYVKIAVRLGISPKTVENHMSAAMEQLSREMDRYDGLAD